MVAESLTAAVDRIILEHGIDAAIAYARQRAGAETGDEHAAWIELLRIGRPRGNWPLADEAARSLMALGEAEYVVELAANHQLRGEFDEATRLLSEAVEGGVAPAALHLAYLLRHRDDATGCAAMLRRFLDTPDVPATALEAARFSLANVAMELGRFGEALEQFEALCRADYVATVARVIDEAVEQSPELWLANGVGQDGVHRHLARLFVAEVCPLDPNRYGDAVQRFLRSSDAAGVTWTLDRLPGIHGAVAPTTALDRPSVPGVPDIGPIVVPVLQLQELVGESEAPGILKADYRLHLLAAVTGGLADPEGGNASDVDPQSAIQLAAELAQARDHSRSARALALLWLQVAEVALVDPPTVFGLMGPLLERALPGLPPSARDAIGDSLNPAVVLPIVVAEYRAARQAAVDATTAATAAAVACSRRLPTLADDASDMAAPIAALTDFCSWLRSEGIGAAVQPLHGPLQRSLERAFAAWSGRGRDDLTSWPLRDSASRAFADIRDVAIESGDGLVALRAVGFMVKAGVGDALDHQHAVARLFRRGQMQPAGIPWAMALLELLRDAGFGDFQGACAFQAAGFERLSIGRPEAEVREGVPAAYRRELELASDWSDADARRIELTELWMGYGRWLDRRGECAAALDAYLQARTIAGGMWGYELGLDALQRAGRPEDVVSAVTERLSADGPYFGLGEPFKLLAGVLEYRTIVDLITSVIESIDRTFLEGLQDPKTRYPWADRATARERATSDRTALLEELTEFIDGDLGVDDDSGPALPECVLSTLRLAVQRALEGLPGAASDGAPPPDGERLL